MTTGGIEVRLLDVHDRQAWSDFVLSCEGSIFQTFEWAEIIQQSGFAWPAIVAALDQGEVIAGCVAALQPIRGLYAYPFVRLMSQGSPLHWTKEGLGAVLRGLRRRFSNVMSVSFPFSDPGLKLQMIESGYQCRQSCTFALDTRRPVLDLWGRLEKRTRYSVGKARKDGTSVEVTSDDAAMRDYLRMHEETCKRNGITPSLSLLSAIWRVLAKEGMAKLFVAGYDGVPLAGAMGLLHEGKMWYFSAASSTGFEKRNAPSLVLWNMIEWAHNHEVKSLDLMGALCTPDISDWQYGPHLFKRGFGGALVQSCDFTSVFHHWPKALWEKFLVPTRMRLLGVRV